MWTNLSSTKKQINRNSRKESVLFINVSNSFLIWKITLFNIIKLFNFKIEYLIKISPLVWNRYFRRIILQQRSKLWLQQCLYNIFWGYIYIFLKIELKNFAISFKITFKWIDKNRKIGSTINQFAKSLIVF